VQSLVRVKVTKSSVLLSSDLAKSTIVQPLLELATTFTSLKLPVRHEYRITYPSS